MLKSTHCHTNRWGACRPGLARWAGLAALAVLCAAQSASAQTMTGFAIKNTNNVGGTSYGWAANYTFNQTFIAQETGFPVELAVNGGNNQNPMTFRLVITASGQTIYDQTYTGLKQRSTDWATSFPITATSRAITAGETVVLSLTPAQQLGVEPLKIDNPAWPRYTLQGYGLIALRFYVKLAQTTVTATAPAADNGGALTWTDGTTCGTTCSKTANTGATMQIAATPASQFSAWGGPCTGQTTATCTFTVAANAAPITATFNPPNYTLRLTPPSAGGSIQRCPGWDPYCIRCGNGMTDCNVTKPRGYVVEFTAYPLDGWAFSGWTGACAGQGSTCSVALNSDLASSATFAQKTLTVATPVNGSVSAPRINCGTQCSAPQPPGSTASITATPVTGYVFNSWTGACAGQGNPCALVMSQDQTVGVNFQQVGIMVLSSATPANGVIVNSGLNCGTTCSANITTNATVGIAAVPTSAASGYLFDAWGGACAGQGQNCSLQMSANRAVSATFRAVGTHVATFSVSGGGSIQRCPGWEPYCVRCGAGMTDCRITQTTGNRVEITAYPGSGKSFLGWTGACAGQGSTCAFNLNSDVTVGANFSP